MTRITGAFGFVSTKDDRGTAGTTNRLHELERSGWLESELWPQYRRDASFEHTMLVLLLINEKIAAQVPNVFDALSGTDGNEQDKDKAAADKNKNKSQQGTGSGTFGIFFDGVVALAHDTFGSLSLSPSSEATTSLLTWWYYESYLCFLVFVYRSLESGVVRACALRYVSLNVWTALSPPRLAEELHRYPALRRHWQQLVQSQQPPPSSSADGGAASGKKRKTSSSSSSSGDSAASASATSSSSSAALSLPEASWMAGLVQTFLRTLDDIVTLPTHTASSSSSSALRCLERFAELLVDLLSQLSTRRFLNTLLDDMHLPVRCKRALARATTTKGTSGDDPLALLRQLVLLVDAYCHFEVNDQTGAELSPLDTEAELHGRVHRLQAAAFARVQGQGTGDNSSSSSLLRDLVFSSPGELLRETTLRKHLDMLGTAELVDLCAKDLGHITQRDLDTFNYNRIADADASSSSSLVSPSQFLDQGGSDGDHQGSSSNLRSFVLDVMVDRLCTRVAGQGLGNNSRGLGYSSQFQLEALNRLSLYPSEDLLFDPHLVPMDSTHRAHHATATAAGLASTDRPLALPKLNLQFLSVKDYLLRNFVLYRLESAFSIREEICDAVRRMGPRRSLVPGSGASTTTFGGWARMAVPLMAPGLSVDEVSKPLLGETVPGHVHATLTVDLAHFASNSEVRGEWESLREHDVVFLVCCENPSPEAAAAATLEQPQQQQQQGGSGSGKKPSSRKSGKGGGSGGGSSEEELKVFVERYGVRCVRGCEIFEVRDEDNNLLNTNAADGKR